VRIRFLDHVVGDCGKRLEYYVYGRIHSLPKGALIIDWWAHIDPAEPDREQGRQIETCRIERPLITEVMVLVPKPTTS